MLYIGIHRTLFALFGGNLNNRSQDGSSYFNLNNDAGNANRNIGASLTYLFLKSYKDYA